MYPYDPNAQPGQPSQPGQPWQPPQQPWQPGQPQPGQWPPQQPPYTQPYAPQQPWQSMPPGQPWPPQQPMQPPPPKKKPRIWLWIVGGIVALAFCSFVSHATQSTTAQTTPDTAQATQAPTATPTQDPTQLPAYQLAQIDASGATPDSATVAKYQRVLDDLHKKTGDSEETIGNETVEGQKLLAQHGRAISLYDLADAADKAIPPGMQKMPYAQVLAALITLMTSNQ